MRKLYLVARHEYLKLVKKRSFIITSLGFPLLLAVIITVSILTSVGRKGNLPVGVVDNAGIISPQSVSLFDETKENDVVFESFENLEAALEQLRSKKIQAVFVLTEDYKETATLALYFLGQRPSEVVQGEFTSFLKLHLMSTQPPAVQNRLRGGTNLTIRSVDGNREFNNRNVINFFVPFIAALIFIIAVMSASGYMLETVTQEKENRTIEILTTSLHPDTLIGGKAIGLMCVGLTQLAIWIVAGVIALIISGHFYEQIQSVTVPWSTLAVVAIFFLPAYALMSGMMTIIGSTVPDVKQGQQISGIINLLFTSPFFFMTLIMAKPNHPIVIGLSLFPTTAFITITMRWAMTTIPITQLIGSLVILIVFAILSIWIAARVFRFGMLRYGQRLKFKEMLTALRMR